MSLRANIDHLSAAQGIEAVAVITPGDTSANSAESAKEFRGDDSWSAVLEGALSLLGKTSESTIRMVIGKHTVVVQTEREETVAVVLPTGHAIAKSLRRMIRRMSRKVRPPLRQESAVMSVSPAQPVQPGAPMPATQDVSPTSPWG
ncbi:MAG: hypothetical protein KUG77_09635 [Nannocystaceae bacterium]|nr:hypothetical protein [Nannocystaceae bacterium]